MNKLSKNSRNYWLIRFHSMSSTKNLNTPNKLKNNKNYINVSLNKLPNSWCQNRKILPCLNLTMAILVICNRKIPYSNNICLESIQMTIPLYKTLWRKNIGSMKWLLVVRTPAWIIKNTYNWKNSNRDQENQVGGTLKQLRVLIIFRWNKNY